MCENKLTMGWRGAAWGKAVITLGMLASLLTLGRYTNLFLLISIG